MAHSEHGPLPTVSFSNLNLEMLILVEGWGAGESGMSREKPLERRDKNQQQTVTLSRHDINSGN